LGIIGWTDIETTGLDEWIDDILEVAFIVTSDTRLTTIARRSWTIQPIDVDATVARIEANPKVLEMHTANGLLEEIRSGKGQPILEVQAEIIEWLKSLNPIDGKIPMGGSGTERFESRWYSAKMPALADLLHYWSYDIGCARRIAKLGGIKPPAEVSVARSGNHRAESDIQQHIDETLWFMRFFSAAKNAGVLQMLARQDAVDAAKGVDLAEANFELEPDG
jgi:oligoribonuclease (3'-5' exoribonuclease)